MANYLSRPADMGKSVPAINLDLVNFVLQSKQQKYDYNLAKIESKIKDELGSIDLERTQDKEYFLNRASEVLNSVGDLGGMDFSKASTTRNLDSKLNTIIDDKILGDVISTSNYRTFQRTLQEKQASGDGTYAEKNVALAMSKGGVNSWLKGEKESLGQVNYEDFTDVDAEKKDIAENLDKYQNYTKEVTPEGIMFKTVEGDYLTAERIKTITWELLSDKAKRQIEINGWYNFDRDDEGARQNLEENFSEFAKSDLESTQETIDKLNLKLKSIGDSNPQRKIELEKEIESYIEFKNKRKEAYNSYLGINQKPREGQEVTKNYDAMSSMLERNNELNSFSNAFAFDDRGVSYSANTAQISLLKAQIKADATSTKTRDDEGLPSATITQKPYTGKDENSLKEVAKQSEDYGSSFKEEVNSILLTLPEDTRNQIKSGYKKDSGISEEDYIYEELNKLDGNNVVSGAVMDRLDNAKYKRDNAQSRYAESKQEGITFREDSDSDKLVQAYYANPAIKVFDKDNNIVSVAKLLDERGIKKENHALLNAPENKDLKETILKHYYVDKIRAKQTSLTTKAQEKALQLTEYFRSIGRDKEGGFLINPEDEKKNDDFINRLKGNTELDPEEAMYMDRLIKLTGSEKAAFNFIQKINRERDYFDSYTVPLGESENGLQNYYYSDPSIRGGKYKHSDVFELDNWITKDNVDLASNEYLNSPEYFQKKGRQLMLNVKVDSDDGRTLVGLTRTPENVVGTDEEGVEVSQLSINKDAGSVAIYSAGPDTVYISGSKKVDGKFVPHKVEILKSAIPQAIQDKVEFDTERPIFDSTNMKEVEGKVTFESVDSTRAITDGAYFLGNELAAVGVTKEGIVQDLEISYPNLMGSVNTPNQYRAMVNNMLNANNLFVKIQEVDGKFYTTILSKNNEKREDLPSETVIYKNRKPLKESLFSEAVRRTRRIPQAYIKDVIEQSMAQASINPDNSNEVMSKLMKIYGPK